MHNSQFPGFISHYQLQWMVCSCLLK